MALQEVPRVLITRRLFGTAESSACFDYMDRPGAHGRVHIIVRQAAVDRKRSPDGIMQHPGKGELGRADGNGTVCRAGRAGFGKPGTAFGETGTGVWDDQEALRDPWNGIWGACSGGLERLERCLWSRERRLGSP